MAIHLNREINKGFTYNPQVDLLPLMAGKVGDKGLLHYFAKKCGIEKDEILKVYHIR